VSEKFHVQLVSLLKSETDAESNELLQERVKKASEFFSDKLQWVLKEILAGFSVETDNKTVRKSITEALSRIRKEGIAKLACLNAVKSGFTINKYLEVKAISSIDMRETKSRELKSVDDTSGIIQHQVLFKQLKEWRNLKAKELDLPHYMIIPQKTMVTLANFMPQSFPALNSVKGMGKKKSEKFGEELLNIIVSYCKEENIDLPV
jgi:superfamily II DNA helicase RecQ